MSWPSRQVSLYDSYVVMTVLIFNHIAVVLLSAANDLRGDLNITIVSSPKLGVDTVCVNQAVNLSCFTNEQTNITWLWSNQSEERSTITVTARQYAVVFTCKASEENGQEGEANVTVIANGENYEHNQLRVSSNSIWESS